MREPEEGPVAREHLRDLAANGRRGEDDLRLRRRVAAPHGEDRERPIELRRLSDGYREVHALRVDRDGLGASARDDHRRAPRGRGERDHAARSAAEIRLRPRELVALHVGHDDVVRRGRDRAHGVRRRVPAHQRRRRRPDGAAFVDGEVAGSGVDERLGDAAREGNACERERERSVHGVADVDARAGDADVVHLRARLGERADRRGLGARAGRPAGARAAARRCRVTRSGREGDDDGEHRSCAHALQRGKRRPAQRTMQ